MKIKLDRKDIKLTEADVSPRNPYGVHLWAGGFDTGLARVVEKGILFPVIHVESFERWDGNPHSHTTILGRILLTFSTIEASTQVDDLIFRQRLLMANHLKAILEGSKGKPGGSRIVISFGQCNVYEGREIDLNYMLTTTRILGLKYNTKAHIRKTIPALFPTNVWKIDL